MKKETPRSNGLSLLGVLWDHRGVKSAVGMIADHYPGVKKHDWLETS